MAIDFGRAKGFGCFFAGEGAELVEGLAEAMMGDWTALGAV
jgi:hypothetical protein